MALREILLPWDSQPQEAAQLAGAWVERGLQSVWLPDVLLLPGGVRIAGGGAATVGPFGAASAFNGTNQSIALGRDALSHGRGARIAWLRVGSASGTRTISGGGNGGTSFRLNGTGVEIINAGVQVDLPAASAVSAGEFCALGMSAEPFNLRIYKNGALLASRSDRVTGTAVNNLDSLGQSGVGNQYFDGAIFMHASFSGRLTDEDQASLFLNPWQLFEPQIMWRPVPAADTGRTAISSLSAIVQQARATGAGFSAAVRVPRTSATSADAAIRQARAAGAALDGAVRHARVVTAALHAAVRSGGTSTAAIDAMVRAGSSVHVALSAAVAARRGESVGLSSVVALANDAAAAIDAAIAMARWAAVGIDVYVQAGFTASTALGAAIRSAHAANASLQAAVAVARTSDVSVGAAVVAGMAAIVGADAAVRAARAGTAALTVFVDDGLPSIDSAFLRYVVPGRDLAFSVPGQSLTYSVPQ